MKIGKLWFDKPRRQEVPDLSDPEVRAQMQKEAKIAVHAPITIYKPKHLRVEHYVTGQTALFTPECSCGTVFKQGYTTLEDLINAAIAHGIDVGRQED